MQSFVYDISPTWQEFYYLKMGCTTSCIIFSYISFIESYYYLCVKKTIEQIYKAICSLSCRLFVIGLFKSSKYTILSLTLKVRPKCDFLLLPSNQDIAKQLG